MNLWYEIVLRAVSQILSLMDIDLWLLRSFLQHAIYTPLAIIVSNMKTLFRKEEFALGPAKEILNIFDIVDNLKPSFVIYTP